MAEDTLKREISDDVVAAGAVVNVAQYLKGIDFPARKEDVERHARERGAGDSALEQIRKLPEATYEDPGQLIAAFGDQVEGL